MRETEASGWIERISSRALMRTLRLAVVALGVGLVMTTGSARAGDDEEDDKTFEEKIIEGIMAGIGGTNMENRGIEYRERSPLVVPPKIDLPPPETVAKEIKARTGRRIRTKPGARPSSRPERSPSPTRSSRPAS